MSDSRHRRRRTPLRRLDRLAPTAAAPVADLTIHTYTAAGSGLLVNSYLPETPAGVVVVDTNLLISDVVGKDLQLGGKRLMVGRALRRVAAPSTHAFGGPGNRPHARQAHTKGGAGAR
jgi:hypothetical protein